MELLMALFPVLRVFWQNNMVSAMGKASWKPPQSRTKVLGAILQYSYFSVISQFPLKTVHPFPSPHPITPWNSEKILDNSSPTLFVGWGEGLDLRELENTPEMQKCPKTFVHDCRNTISKTINFKMSLDAFALKNLCLWCEFQSRLLSACYSKTFWQCCPVLNDRFYYKLVILIGIVQQTSHDR